MYIVYIYIYYIFTGISNWKKQHLETHRPANIEKRHQIASCPTIVQRSWQVNFMLLFFLQLQLDIIGASRLQYICSLIASMCVFRGLPVRTGLKGKSTDESDDTSFGVFMVPCHHRKLGAFLQMFPTKNPNPMMILQAFFNGAMCSCGATCQTDFPNGRTT